MACRGAALTLAPAFAADQSSPAAAQAASASVLPGDNFYNYANGSWMQGACAGRQLTLSENLADLAGLAVCYDGFKASRQGKPVQTDTDRQFFAVAAAFRERAQARLSN